MEPDNITKNDTLHISSPIEPHELEKFKEFSSRARCYYDENDERILAWLRARDFNLEKSEQMLRRHLIWRQNNHISEMLGFKSQKNIFPFLHSGSCKTGGPVFIFPIGFWDIRGLIERGDILSMIEFFFHVLEKFLFLGRVQNRFIQGVIICDFSNFSYSQITHRTAIQGIVESVNIFEANYPEVAKAIFVINAPLVFNIAFQIVKPLLHSRTLSKIQIFRSDGSKWKNALLEEIEENELPPHWGGTKNGVDEFCSESWSSSPLPPYYFRKITPNFHDEYGNEWIELVVKSGEILEFPISISTENHNRSDEIILSNELYNVPPNSFFNWSFYVEDASRSQIDAALLKEDNNETLHEKKDIISSDKCRETGQVQLDESGKFIFKLHCKSDSNRDIKLHYSFFHSAKSSIQFLN